MSARPPHLSPHSVRRVGELEVAYRRAGEGSTLVYFHGMGLTRRWLRLHAALSTRFDVLALEHPGFGDTPRPRWYRGLDDIAVGHADVLDALGVQRFHLVGHSLGGLIAGTFAALYPERVRTMTLIAPAPLPVVTPPERRAPALPDPLPPGFDFDHILFNGHASSYPDYLKGDDDGDFLAEIDDDPFADPEAFQLDGSASLYRRLARIQCPCQILIPDEDRVVDHLCFADWARWLGGAHQVTITGNACPTGHLLIVQEPEQITEAVERLAGIA